MARQNCTAKASHIEVYISEFGDVLLQNSAKGRGTLMTKKGEAITKSGRKATFPLRPGGLLLFGP